MPCSASPATARRAAHRHRGRRPRQAAWRMELGGKNAIVVMDDADLDLAVEGILWSAFGTSGQRCTACSRVIVDARHRRRPRGAPGRPRRRAAPGLGSRLRRPGRSAHQCGAVEKVARYSASRIDEGAELVTGGRAGARRRAWPRATSSSPRSSTASRPMARVAQEEIFGPVLSIIRVRRHGRRHRGRQRGPLRPVLEHLHVGR